MQAKRPDPSGSDTEKSTPSQKLRDIFRVPRRGEVRSANDNAASAAWIIKKVISIGVPFLALGILGMAVFLGGR